MNRITGVILLLAAAVSVPILGVATAAETTPAVPPTTAGAASNSTVCSLRLEGFGSRPGIKTARLSCTGGPIKAAVHQDVQQIWKRQQQTPNNVQLSTDKACNSTPGCLVTICGRSNAVFVNASVTDLTATQGWWVGVCVQGQSSVTFQNGNFSFNSMITAMKIRGPGTSVLLSSSTLRNNTATYYADREGGELPGSSPPPGWRIFVEAQRFNDLHSESACGRGPWNRGLVFSSGILVQDASLDMWNGTVAGNLAAHYRLQKWWPDVKINFTSGMGPLTVLGASIVRLHNTLLARNTAAMGGAIFVADKAQMHISSCRFCRNEALNSGGAVHANTCANVTVTSSMQGSGKGWG